MPSLPQPRLRPRRTRSIVLAMCCSLVTTAPALGQGPDADIDATAGRAAAAAPAEDHRSCDPARSPRPLTCRAAPSWAGQPPAHAPSALVAHRPAPAAARDAASRAGNPVASRAIWIGLLGAVPGVAIGATIDRKLLGNEHGESPGLTGAFVGGTLGYGLGGILGAHWASGGRGNVWIPLAVLGGAAGLMAVDLKAGFGATLIAVSVAIAIES